MTLGDLENYVKLTSVLSEDEVTPEMSALVLDDSLDLLNSFYPKLMNTMAYNYTPGKRYKVWDVQVDPLSGSSFSEGRILEDLYGADLPCKIVAVDWDLEMIEKERNTWLDNVLRQLFECNYVIRCSNKRRQANINELPFDMKGQDFYQEYTEKLNELRTLLINSTPHLL